MRSLIPTVAVCLLGWPKFLQAATISALNADRCLGGGIGVMKSCPNMQPGYCCAFRQLQAAPSPNGRPNWYTVGSVEFKDVWDLDDSHWMEAPNPGCNGYDVGASQDAGTYPCHSRNIGTGQWSKKTPDRYNRFIGGGGIYHRTWRQLPAPQPGGGYRAPALNLGQWIGGYGGSGYRARRRAAQLEPRGSPTASSTEQCTASAATAGPSSSPSNCQGNNAVHPIYYGWPDDGKDNGVWILEPVPEAKMAAFHAELDKKPYLDVIKEFGAKYVADPKQDPNLAKIMTNGTSPA